MAVQEIVKGLHEERNKLWNEQTALLDKADADNKRDLTAAENEEYTRRNDRMNEIDARTKELIDAQQRQKDAEESFRKLELTPQTGPADGGAQRGGDGASADEQLRQFFRGEIPFVEFKRDKQAVPMPFRRGARGSCDLPPETRDTVVGTPSAGGYTVPVTFINRLMEHAIEVSALLSAGPTVITTDAGEEMRMPKTSAHSQAARVSEGGQIPQSDPAFGQVVLNAYKYALLLKVSREVLEDTGVDLEGYLARQAGRAIGNKYGAEMMVGTGIGMPGGLVPLATVGKTGSLTTAGEGVAPKAVGGFIADNLIDLFYSVIGPYRKSPSAAWLMEDATLGHVRKLKDEAGQYLWHPATMPGEPDTILSKPVHTDPNMPLVGAGNRSVLFGDISTYIARVVNGVRFERSDQWAFDTDMIAYRAVLRGDGDLSDTTGAVKAFVGGAS